MFRLLFLLALTHAALALEIKQVRWGFDGKTMPDRFNLLSVLVAQEAGGRPFDGELALAETRGAEQTVGAPLVQALYLTPGTERWVQFLPFVSQEYEWRLRWGKGDSAVAPVIAPKFGPPATVIAMDLTSVFAANTRLAAFPEELFPTSVAATDALDQIVFDHVPRWDAPRREAFLDWVRRGGIVHLVPGAEGYPHFDGELAVLNVPEKSTAEESRRPESRRIGTGRAVRHGTKLEEFDAAFLQKAGYAVREFQKPDGNSNSQVIYRFDQTLLQNLASLTKPQVQWWLLYLLTIAYLAFIGPVHYIWSRKVDWRMALGGFLGTVAVFALAFIVAGHRGSGEKQTTHSLAIARSLGGDRWDVQEWVSAFATKGDYYKLTHTAPANYYAVPGDEQVSAKAYPGKDGHLDADIPLYSARPFLHRAVMSGPKAEVKVVEWSKDALTLETGEAFPGELVEACGRGFDKIITFEHRGHALAWSRGGKGSGDEHSMFFTEQKLRAIQSFEWGNRTFDAGAAFTPLFARFLGDVNGMTHPTTSRPLSTDQLQLFLFAEAPESFAMKGTGFDRGHGHVLYVIDVFRPAEPQP